MARCFSKVSSTRQINSFYQLLLFFFSLVLLFAYWMDFPLNAAVYFLYDLSPITVTIREERRNFLHFITRLCAVLGGTFALTGLPLILSCRIYLRYKVPWLTKSLLWFCSSFCMHRHLKAELDAHFALCEEFVNHLLGCGENA